MFIAAFKLYPLVFVTFWKQHWPSKLLRRGCRKISIAEQLWPRKSLLQWKDLANTVIPHTHVVYSTVRSRNPSRSTFGVKHCFPGVTENEYSWTALASKFSLVTTTAAVVSRFLVVPVVGGFSMVPCCALQISYRSLAVMIVMSRLYCWHLDAFSRSWYMKRDLKPRLVCWVNSCHYAES